MARQLTDRVALVTGASSGIGAAVARELAGQGCHVVLCARREDRLQEVAVEVEGLGRKAVPITCDVTRDGDVERAAAAARDEFGRLDVVVANAGFGVAARFSSLTLEDYRRQLETNVFGVLRTVYATLDDLKRSSGCLAVTGSVMGFLALPGSSPYSMSKAAVHSLAASLWHELRPYGVAVVLLAPGFVGSEIRKVDRDGVYHPETADHIPGWLQMSTEVAARKIVRAIRRRRRLTVITGHGKLAVFLQRHAPALANRLAGLAAGRRR